MRQETRDLERKTAVHWVSKSIRRLTRRNSLEQWEAPLANAEATPQGIWPIAKSLINRDGPRAPTDIHGTLGLKFHPTDKANAIAVPKTSSHHTTFVTKTMNGGWMLETKFCLKLQRPCDPLKFILPKAPKGL
jgi:hypothetical protein